MDAAAAAAARAAAAAAAAAATRENNIISPGFIKLAHGRAYYDHETGIYEVTVKTGHGGKRRSLGQAASLADAQKLVDAFREQQRQDEKEQLAQQLAQQRLFDGTPAPPMAAAAAGVGSGPRSGSKRRWDAVDAGGEEHGLQLPFQSAYSGQPGPRAAGLGSPGAAAAPPRNAAQTAPLMTAPQHSRGGACSALSSPGAVAAAGPGVPPLSPPPARGSRWDAGALASRSSASPARPNPRPPGSLAAAGGLPPRPSPPQAGSRRCDQAAPLSAAGLQTDAAACGSRRSRCNAGSMRPAASSAARAAVPASPSRLRPARPGAAAAADTRSTSASSARWGGRWGSGASQGSGAPQPAPQPVSQPGLWQQPPAAPDQLVYTLRWDVDLELPGPAAAAAAPAEPHGSGAASALQRVMAAALAPVDDVQLTSRACIEAALDANQPLVFMACGGLMLLDVGAYLASGSFGHATMVKRLALQRITYTPQPEAAEEAAAGSAQPAAAAAASHWSPEPAAGSFLPASQLEAARAWMEAQQATGPGTFSLLCRPDDTSPPICVKSAMRAADCCSLDALAALGDPAAGMRDEFALLRAGASRHVLEAHELGKLVFAWRDAGNQVVVEHTPAMAIELLHDTLWAFVYGQMHASGGVTYTGLGELDAARLILQLLRALQDLHARGIAHRDVKASNLLVRAPDCPPFDENGKLVWRGVPASLLLVKVADFGAGWRRQTLDLTEQPSTLVGTPGHIAPELYSVFAAQHAPANLACAAVVRQGLEQRMADDVMRDVQRGVQPASYDGSKADVFAAGATYLEARFGIATPRGFNAASLNDDNCLFLQPSPHFCAGRHRWAGGPLTEREREFLRRAMQPSGHGRASVQELLDTPLMRAAAEAEAAAGAEAAAAPAAAAQAEAAEPGGLPPAAALP